MLVNISIPMLGNLLNLCYQSIIIMLDNLLYLCYQSIITMLGNISDTVLPKDELKVSSAVLMTKN